ncbi:unnamed protein product [Phyllotreta striolata]|uniref:Uncharacterized protein n=1 Tax=Phyllotreta striolata TaxID=444603 RepID=A0A9P0GVD0_PHYSR|nr:unnamed protein product [Phyllotreta striolata]
MYFAILRLTVSLTFIWNITVGTQEFLEYYQPRPDFPKELNEWLAYVQGHRNDFRIIRNIVKRRKAESDYYDERESEENKLLSDLEGEDETPQNDIYPRDNIEKLDKSAVSTAKSRTNKAKRKLSKPARTRRESDENSFFEHTNTINVDPKGKVGEIKRSEVKYPDQFVNRPKDDDKREIEIHILNDGKLLKSLKDEKSIVLNIENNDDNHPTAAAANDNIVDSHAEVVNSPERSVDNDKEAASNFRNLFTANENLNTDSSVAREALGKTSLLYHVTLPSPNFMAPQDTYDNTSTLENHFQHNHFRDMSRYWSDVEKNQLQQGIEFAQEAGNLRKQNQKSNNDGFETARTIIIEHVANNPSSNNQKDSRFDMKRNSNNVLPTRAPQEQFEQPLKELDYTMKSNIDEVEVVHNNVKKNNHIIIITEKDTNEQDKLRDQRPVPSSSNKIDENINNLISITIVVPRKDEEPKEETKNHDTSTKLADFGKIERTTMEQNIDQKNIQLDLNPETTTEEAHKTQFSGQLCEEGQCHNDRELRLQKFRQREDDRRFYGSQEEKPFPLLRKEVIVPYEVNNPRYLSRQSSSDFVKFPLNADSICQGPNCFKDKSCQGPNCKTGTVKYKRRRGKRRHKHRPEFDHSDYIQTYKSRQLKEVNYVYDADLEAPSPETVSSERSKRLGLNKDVGAEGDYGDEEDSASVRSNVTTKLIKKVDDVFANPHTTCEPDDEDYYYDEIDDKNKNSNTNNHDVPHSNVDTVSVGKRLHKKTKNPSKVNNRNKGEPEVIQSQIREPRDIDQLPKFVINDEINEENLRKRSLANQKEQQNKFPLSSKSFFASNNVKRRDSGDSDLVNDKTSAPSGSDKSVTIGDAMAAGASVAADKEAAAIGDALGQTELSVSAVTDECLTSTHVSVGPVCETDNFTKIKVTTMLNLAAAGENQGDLNNSLPSLSEQYQNLEDILVGRLPLSIVDSVFKHMKIHPTFKQRFFRGMKKKNLPVSFKNLPEISSKESNKLIRLMSKIINRLQWTTTCQTLPNKLKRYLKTITSTKVDDRLTKTKTMEEIDQAENQNQTSFIFHSSTGVDNIEEKVRILKNMLIKYQHLPESCKPRAEPVKEYIENHLDMLTHAMSSNMDPSHREDGVKDSSSDVSHHEASKRNEKGDDSDLIEHELESLGLGKHPKFRPNFDLESLLKNSDKTSEQGSQEGKIAAKKTNKRAAIRETSEEYDKLLEAVKKERIKREGKKRIAEAFGKLSIDDYKGTNTENIIDEIFENPLVYSF